VSAWRDDRIAQRTWLQLGRYSVLFGRLSGDAGIPIWTIMREAESIDLLPTTEVVDGVETFVLKSRGKYGQHQVWLDPASGGLPRRIEIQKIAGNLFNDEQLGTNSAPDVEQAAGRRLRLPARREYSDRIYKICVENKGRLFAITGFDDEFSITYADGKKQAGKKEYKVRALDVDPNPIPENALEFDVEIPNGTRVVVYDNFPLEYSGRADINHEWVDGKIEKLAGK